MTDRLGIWLAILSGCSFGTLGIFGRAVMLEAGLGLTSLLAIRFTGMAIFVFGWRLIDPPVVGPRRAKLQALLTGGAIYGPGTLCLFAAMERIGVGAAVLLLYLFPILTTAYECLSQRRLPGPGQTIALGLGVAGAGLCTELGPSHMDWLGVAFGLSSAALYSAYLITISHIGKSLDSRTSTAFVAAGAGLVFTALATTRHGIQLPWTQLGWALTLGLILIATVLPIVSGFAAIQRIGVAKTSILSMTDPLVAVTLGHFAYGESLGPAKLLGGSMILSALAIIRLQPRRASSTNS